MPTITPTEATRRLADAVETAKPHLVKEYHEELMPDRPLPTPVTGPALAALIRGGLEPDELVQLWHVVFTRDRDVWYNEETDEIHMNEQRYEPVDWRD